MRIANNKKLIITVVAIAIVLLSATVGYFIYNKYIVDDIAISVNGQSLTKKQYLDYKKEYESSRTDSFITSDFKQYIINGLLYAAAAKDFNINVSEEEFNQAINDFAYPSNTNDWQKFVAKSSVLKKKLEFSASDNLYAHFVFPYSRLFASGFEKNRPEGYGDQAKIADDKKYAKDKADEYYAVLKKDSSLNTASGILLKIINDKRLSYGFSGNTSEIISYLANGSIVSSNINDKTLSDNEKNIITGLKGLGVIKEESRSNVSFLPGYNKGEVLVAYDFYSKLSNNKNKYSYEAYMKNAKVKDNVKN